MVDGVLIRKLRREDAPAVAALHLAVNPHQLETPERVWYWANRGLEREQWQQWVAEAGGEIIGSAWAAFEWAAPTPGRGRFWVAVAPKRRGGGIGGALYAVAQEYLRGRGAWRARANVDGDPAGARFLAKRGYTRSGADRVAALDVLRVELPEPGLPAGFRLEPLGRVRDHLEELFAICAAGEVDLPGNEPGTAMTLEDWKVDDYGLPDLSEDGSFIALADERAVSLAFLCLDPQRKLAYNQMTATLPEFRRQGLALAVKLAASRWAQAAGFERILTENDAENTGMLAINERLGYRHLYDQTKWALEWEGPPAESR